MKRGLFSTSEPAEPGALATFEGTLERITFTNEENAWSVVKLAVPGRRELVTVVGNLLGVQPGESLRVTGRWVTDKKYGEQFRAESCVTIQPGTLFGIKKYLGSGLVRGLGPVLAERLVEAFGIETLEVIDTSPERLAEVEGIGPVRSSRIKEAWAEQRSIKDVMVFLQSQGISTSFAVKIYKQYGDRAIAVVREDPYRLAADIFGIGFKTADRIASRLGVPRDSPRRIEAGLLHVLGQGSDEGHVYLPRAELVRRAAAMLEADAPKADASSGEGTDDRRADTARADAAGASGAAPDAKAPNIAAADDGDREAAPPDDSVGIRAAASRRDRPAKSSDRDSRDIEPPGSAAALTYDVGPLVESAIDRMARDDRIVVEGDGDDAGQAVFLKSLHAAEAGVASALARVLAAPLRPIVIDVERALVWYEERRKIVLAPQQREAIRRAIAEKALVITGGPGTGKTTLVNGILEILEKKGRRIALAAPTGRAAKRMQETTGREAKTIHRLLEFSPKNGAFGRDRANPLEADLLILDEASMLDTVLANAVLRALPERAQVVFVGDVDQIPSVGPGKVLADLIRSNVVPVVRLTEIFRQAETSLIVEAAHRVNRGEMPPVEGSGEGADFFFVAREDPEQVLEVVKDLVAERIPKRFRLDPLEDVQVLTPMHRGLLGAASLNAQLQALLNPSGPSLSRGSRTLRAGDKVMQIRNNYDLEVFNGDIGRIVEINDLDRELRVRFEERIVTYDYADLDELVLAYACSIHKSQGSEYPCVVIPLHTQHYVMLRRNLLYTAITRGRRLVVLTGSRRALAIAVKNARIEPRYTRLAERLAGR